MKITKRNFELHLFALNGGEQLETRKHIEDGEEQGDYTICHLYYNKNGHCGTWCKGKGHVFEDTFLPRKWGAYNHNGTLLGEFSSKLKAEKEAREYTYQTENASYVEEIQA